MPQLQEQALAPGVTHRLIGGTSALAAGVMIERGAGFAANILAARFGGTLTFGAYSLAISTANQISTYAAGGIGATATRFSGKYPQGTTAYSSLARALAIVSLASAALAAGALWLGAGPLAHLLGKPQLVTLLRWASLSAAGIILLECARGFFVGQRRLLALLLLSVLVGTGMAVLLPAAAKHHSPTRMIVMQGAITTSAVLVCLVFARPLGLHLPATANAGSRAPLLPMLREVWGFGLVQLAGLVASNLSGWWLTTLVARSDTSLVQMSFFAIASQLRNLVGIAPALLTEGSYAVMADPEGEHTRTPHRVMALCSFASLSLALVLASLGIVFVPWGAYATVRPRLCSCRAYCGDRSRHCRGAYGQCTSCSAAHHCFHSVHGGSSTPCGRSLSRPLRVCFSSSGAARGRPWRSISLRTSCRRSWCCLPYAIKITFLPAWLPFSPSAQRVRPCWLRWRGSAPRTRRAAIPLRSSCLGCLPFLLRAFCYSASASAGFLRLPCSVACSAHSSANLRRGGMLMFELMLRARHFFCTTMAVLNQFQSSSDGKTDAFLMTQFEAFRVTTHAA